MDYFQELCEFKETVEALLLWPQTRLQRDYHFENLEFWLCCIASLIWIFTGLYFKIEQTKSGTYLFLYVN